MGKATIHLERLTVVNKREVTSKDDVYLWVMGMQIVLPKSDVPGLEFMLKKSPLPGNVGGPLGRGDQRTIPAGVGHFEYPITPLGVLIFGVVVVAWEHDRTPDPTIQLAYDRSMAAIDQGIRGIVDARLQEGPDPKTGRFRGVSQAEQDAIRGDVKEIVKDLLLGSVGSAPWSINLDDFVGGERIVETVVGDVPFVKNFTLDLRRYDNVGAHYQVTVALRYDP